MFKLLWFRFLFSYNISLVEGSDYVRNLASPLLYEPIWQAAKSVKCPNPEYSTLYDEWLSVYSKDYNGIVKPLINNLGSGSDYVSFIQTYGISCTDTSYVSMQLYIPTQHESVAHYFKSEI